MGRLRVAAAALLALSLGAGGCSRGDAVPASAEALSTRAADWLWSRQAADGGWHATTYGFLRSGQALTPFVLDALLRSPAARSRAPSGAVERALAFVRAGVDDDGSLGRRDPDVLEYPNYATSYGVLCLLEAGSGSDRRLVDRMCRRLLSEQYREDGGFRPDDPAYGGWGFGGTQPRGVPGHMDLAHTRRVLDALAAAGRLDDATRSRAETFLRRVQNLVPSRVPLHHVAEDGQGPDGGFWFSPVVLSANKAPNRGGLWGSYATATCDGLLSLLAAGVPASDDRVRQAREWLEGRPGLDAVAGIPSESEQPTRWGGAIRYYHLAVRAEAGKALGAPSRREEVAALLRGDAKPDGSFANDNPLMKEDEPLIATALALVALAR
jgi:hypothetical protein